MASIYINPIGDRGGTDISFDDLIPSGAAKTVQSSPYQSAISSIESGGKYGELGPVTRTGDRAYGKYQIMGSNIPQWSQEVLGRKVTPQEFLANPQVQDQIFNSKFGSYVDKYGPEGAAKAWFAGEKGMNDPNRKDQLGTSVADYARKFNAAASAATPANTHTSDISFDDLIPKSTTTELSASGPSVGAGEAFGRTAAQGLSGNFYDELRGLMEAGGLNPKDPASLSKLIQGAYKYWSGDPEAAKAYEAGANRERAATTLAETQHPYISTVGNVAGAVALPLGGLMGAATLPGRMARGAAVGGAYGALSGAGQGENPEQRLSGAALQGAGGVLLGGVAPPVVEGAIQGARGLLTAPANLLRSALNPQAEAARRVATQVERGLKFDPTAASRLTPQELVNTPQAMVMDIGGEPVRALARATADISPEARQVMNAAINKRFEGQPGRLSDWFNSSFNFPNAKALEDAIDAAAKSVNSATYGAARAKGRAGIMDQELYDLASAPAMRTALKGAIEQAQNKSAKDVSQGINALTERWVSKDGKPTLELWDLIKKKLDGQINRAKKDREDFSDLTALKNKLVEKLDFAVPEYAVARAGAAGFFGAENALQAGQKFVTENFANAGTRQALAKMTPEERKLFQDGFVSRYLELLHKAPDRRNAVNNIANSGQAREKLDIALGPQKAKELEAKLRVEGIMDLARDAVQGNSKTARYLLDASLAYGVGTGGDVFNPDPQKMLNAALAFGTLRGKRAVNENVARQVAALLTSNDPKLLLRGIQTITRNQNLFNSLRSADTALARVAAQRTPQIPGIAGANEQQ